MIFSTDKFFFTKESNLFSQEVSSLTSGIDNIFHRIYNDSYDQGITLVSQVTGISIDFYVNDVDEYGEEIAGWNLLPTTESIKKYPRIKDCKILIIND